MAPNAPRWKRWQERSTRQLNSPAQSTERNWKIVCHVDAPLEFKATYPAQHGETLVGVTASGARITLARVGQTVEIEASPKTLKEQTLTLGAGRLVATD